MAADQGAAPSDDSAEFYEGTLMDGLDAAYAPGSTVARLDRLRHRIPFWWWLTYDALVALVIVIGVRPFSPAFWLGFAVLAIAVGIDTVEFIVKRPSVRVRLDTDAS